MSPVQPAAAEETEQGAGPSREKTEAHEALDLALAKNFFAIGLKVPQNLREILGPT
jgi:hypothetical protein